MCKDNNNCHCGLDPQSPEKDTNVDLQSDVEQGIAGQARNDGLFDKNMDKIDELAFHYSEILKLLGEDPTREGLQKTPKRVAKSMLFLTQGYQQNPDEILSSAIFMEDYKQMVIVKDIDFYSMCEHHLLPFFGKVHVAYIPNHAITGLSKIPRIVEVFARRLQVQERMTTQIKDCIQQTLNPLGVMVVIEAQHLCMQMRGVEKQNSITTTSDFTGAFEAAKTREEFIALIKR
ncbi:GTP cyclohydrolase 1 [Bacteroidia bacterium]|nr:GTP cyclohydrolase 1 [Bacteroidia bacterium]